MKYLIYGLLAYCCGGPGWGQQVVLADGEVLSATVQKVADNRVQLKTADGRILRYAPNRLRYALDEDGRRRRFPAALLPGPMSSEKQTWLKQLQAGKQLDEAWLFILAEDCSQDLFAALKELSQSADSGVQAQVYAVLALVGSPESVTLALEAAVHSSSAAVRAAAAQHLSSAVAIGAIEAAGLIEELEAGLQEKNKLARFSIAYAATELGSDLARPVLAKYVRDRDHHIREAAALALAEQGDAAGEKVLLQMLKRKESPMIAANRDADPAFLAQLRRADERERIHVCELVGQLQLESAHATLKSLSKSDSSALSTAAKNALKRLESASQEP